MIDAILGVIGTILYPLFSIIFVLLDLVQDIFQAFAGVGTIYYNEGGGTGANANLDKITSGEIVKNKDFLRDNNGGIVYYLLRSDLVMNIVWSIATLALILLIVFTVIAFIKNIYAPKSKSWQEIIGLSVKGLFNFIFIPVICLLGVFVGNILLNAIDGATSTGGATLMSRKLFLSAAYDANRVRQDFDSDGKLSKETAIEALKVYDHVFDDEYTNKTGTDVNATYKIIEEHFPNGQTTTDDENVVSFYANLIDTAYGAGDTFGVKNDKLYRIDTWGWADDGYNLWSINYLTLAVGGVFMLYALGAISFGMIKRMFTLIILFIISPAACAMYPLDEGNACKKITGDFKSNTISAYGAVAGMNIFFSIAPLVQNINLAGATFFQSIIHIILLTCGLYMVKDFISKISSTFGAENAYESGAGMMSRVKKDVGGRAAKGIKGTVGATGRFIGAWKEGGFGAANKQFWVKDVGKGILSGLNNAGKTISGIDVKDDIIDPFVPSLKKGRAAAKADKDKKTKGEFGEKEAKENIDKLVTDAASNYADDLNRITDYRTKFAADLAIRTPGASETSVRDAVLSAGGTEEDADNAVNAYRAHASGVRADKMLGKIKNDEAKTAIIDLAKKEDYTGKNVEALGLTLDKDPKKKGQIKNKNEDIEKVLNIVGMLDNYSKRLASAETIQTQKGIAQEMQGYLNGLDPKGNKEIQSLIDAYQGLAIEIKDNTGSSVVEGTRRGKIDDMVTASGEIGKAIADVVADADKVKKKIKENQKPEEKK